LCRNENDLTIGHCSHDRDSPTKTGCVKKFIASARYFLFFASLLVAASLVPCFIAGCNARLTKGHPHRDYVFEAFGDALPPDFLAVAFLDSANGAAIEDGLQNHPFDSESGWNRRCSWLEDRDPGSFSYAHSAAAALPFLSNPPRDQLLALALEHVDAGVQMEGAWAAGKLGSEAGLNILVQFSQDVSPLRHRTTLFSPTRSRRSHPSQSARTIVSSQGQLRMLAGASQRAWPSAGRTGNRRFSATRLATKS